MIHSDMSGSEYARLPLRVPKEQLDSVCNVGTYGEDVFYVIENENWFWMGPFVPKLQFLSLTTGIVYFRTELPETRHILGVEANAKEKTFAYCCRFVDIQINIYSTGADYNTVLTHVFRTPMTCGGSGLSAAFASPNVGEYILLWGNISNDSFFHVYTVKTIEDTPVHTVSSLERVDCHDVHACVRFQLMDVVYPAADDCVYYCHARGVGRDAPDHLSLMVYHAQLTGSEKAKVVFGSIVQLPFDMYYADTKDRAVGEHEFFGCEAVIQKLFLARCGSTVCLLKIYLSKHVSSSADLAVDSDVPVAATSHKKTKIDREFEDQAVFLLVSFQDNTVLDMSVAGPKSGGFASSALLAARVLKDCEAAGIAIFNTIFVVSILMADLWNQLRDLLIREAEIPPDSQKTIITSKAVERCLMYATAYGDEMYCLVLDPNPLDVWECNPVIKFLPASGDVSYPATKLPETRHVLGIEANAAQSTIVMGHFMYTDLYSLICIDIYAINANYQATLMQSFSTETNCSGSGLLGTFVSPQVDQYIVLWRDLTNNDYFDTFSAKKISTSPERTATACKRNSVREFKFNFQKLSELYPATDNTVYNCHAYGVGHQHPNHLAVLVYHAHLDNRAEPRIVFHTVIKLPLQLCFRTADVLDGASVRFPAVIVRMKQAVDGSQVCLVRVSVEVVSDSGITADEGDRATITTTVSQADHPTSVVPRTTTAHQYVYLLMSIPNHTVIDMHIPRKYEKCTIDVTGRFIVRFGAKMEA